MNHFIDGWCGYIQEMKYVSIICIIQTLCILIENHFFVFYHIFCTRELRHAEEILTHRYGNKNT